MHVGRSGHCAPRESGAALNGRDWKSAFGSIRQIARATSARWPGPGAALGDDAAVREGVAEGGRMTLEETVKYALSPG